MRSSESKQRGREVRLRLASIAIVALMAMVLFVGAAVDRADARAYTPQPTGSGVVTIEPNPSLEGNVTIATHNSTWGPLGYGTTSQITLPGIVDPRVSNPVVVNPATIVSSAFQGNKITGTYWNTTGFWNTGLQGAACGDAVTGPTAATANGQPAIQYTVNASNACNVQADAVIKTAIPFSQWPSTSPQFNVVSIGASISGPACTGTGGPCFIEPFILNASGSGTPNAFLKPNLATGGLACTATSNPRGSFPAAGQWVLGSQGYATATFQQVENGCGVGLNVSGAGASATVAFGVGINLAKFTSTPYTITIYALQFGTTPLTLGTTIWKAGGKNTTVTQQDIIGSANLSALAPSFTYSQITGGGYTVAVQERAVDLPGGNQTVTSSPISVANATAGGPSYVEQVSYSFGFQEPVSAALTYGTFKLIDTINVSGVQYATVSFAGTSYTSTYAAYTLGKLQTVQSAVSPTTAASWVGIVQYTGTQWDSISGPPGFLSATGFQYYWFVFLGLILSTLGMGSAWVTRNQRNLRVRKGSMDLTFRAFRRQMRRGPPAKLRGNTIGAGRHHAMIALGLVFLAAGLASAWAFQQGSDTNGIVAAFLGAMILVGIAAAIGYGGYELAHHVRHRRS